MIHEHADIPLVLQRALRSARSKSVPGGQIVLYEGDMPGDALILREGIVKLYDIDEQGNEKLLHLVKPPAVIPFAFFSGMRDPLRRSGFCSCHMLLSAERIGGGLSFR
jgi:CRP-like cAMP-binding protein